MLGRPDYKGVVACTPGEEKVVGFLIWRRPKEEGEQLEEWTPKLPEGTNERFLEVFLSAIEKGREQWSVEDLFVEIFSGFFCFLSLVYAVLMRRRA